MQAPTSPRAWRQSNLEFCRADTVVTSDLIDCAIVGGGPAGLTAAIYLARFRLRIRLIDGGDSRAAWIPISHNHAGYPEGISGVDLLTRMREQAERYGVHIVPGQCDALEHAEDGFMVHGPGTMFNARTILLATGVVNHRPPGIDDAFHADALARGLLRYCPVCDGYEVTDRDVAVIGTGTRGYKEAIFLRGYTKSIALIAPEGTHDLDEEARIALIDAGVDIVADPAAGYRIAGDRIAVRIGSGERDFDSLYPALGSKIRSDLMLPLGADLGEDGCVVVDRHQRTEIAGLYAAGDVVQGLDQISHAMGEAGVAATTIRNDLAERSPLRR
jgi:thioredoxin reductase (NADPH)